MTLTAGGANRTVAVIGLGYIGLPTAAVLAQHGTEVIGVDVNAATVDAVNRGEVPFVEPDLEVTVSMAVARGLLRAETKTPVADVFVVAVPTPFTPDHEPDLSYVDAAADGIAPRLNGGELVVLESTSPPGTTRRMAERILAQRPDLTVDGDSGSPVVHFAHCPERVLPGRIMAELVANDRIIGGLTPEAAERARQLYSTFCSGAILLTDDVTAELAKLVENSFRDVNIAFANELSAVCARLGVDVHELISLANHHPRVDILRPGPGVGGHCIAVDPWFIVASTPDEAVLIRAAREVNDRQPGRVASAVAACIAERAADTVAVLGLAFKPNVDDVRMSPAVDVVTRLAADHPHVHFMAVDPFVPVLPDALRGRPNVTLSSADVIDTSDLVVVLVEHDAFAALAPRADRPVLDSLGRERRGVQAESARV